MMRFSQRENLAHGAKEERRAFLMRVLVIGIIMLIAFALLLFLAQDQLL